MTEEAKDMTGEGRQPDPAEPQVEGGDVPTPPEGEDPVPGQPGIEEAGERVTTPPPAEGGEAT